MSGFNEIIEVILRSFLSLFILFILTKKIGARQISQLTYYDYVIGITIGSIASDFALDTDISVIMPITAMIVCTFVTIVLAVLSDKSIFARKTVTGTPSVLIYKGKIIEENLKKNHLDINELLTQCRINGYFSVSDIYYAIFETTGAISFKPKESQRGVVLSDLNLKEEEKGLMSNVILDGKIMEDNLKRLGVSVSELKKKLKQKGYKKEEDILLATLNENKDLNVFLRGEEIKNEDFFI